MQAIFNIFLGLGLTFLATWIIDEIWFKEDKFFK